MISRTGDLLMKMRSAASATIANRAKTTRERNREARPEGVHTFAAACYSMEKENPGTSAGAPRENILALFKPGDSPSAPARKLLALVLHHAGNIHADQTKTWPANNIFRFKKSDLLTSSHSSTDRLAEALTEAGAIRLVMPGMLAGKERGRSYIAVFPRFSISEAGEDLAPVEIQLAEEVAEMVKSENEFGRLDLVDFLALEGRVAVTLYQIGKLVVGMTNRPYEEISINDIRQRLGLRKDEYEAAKDLRKLLERSAAEVSRTSIVINMRVDAIKQVASAKRGPAASIRAFRIVASWKSATEMLAMQAERRAAAEAKLEVAEEKGKGGKKGKLQEAKGDPLANVREGMKQRMLHAAQQTAIHTWGAVERAERREAEMRSPYAREDRALDALDEEMLRFTREQAGRVVLNDE